jgi:2-polyprenyl-3-methyl-5-hydroxy-6-metoxy-1,4-benzoquinol methylase
MVKASVYNVMYRTWAPWDRVGVRGDLVRFLNEGRINRAEHQRTIELGCGTGANVVYLAEHGFHATGIDFSHVAIRKAERRAASAGVEATFVAGDLTAPAILGIKGPFDFIIDFGTLDDLRGEARRAMADTVIRLSRPGTVFLEYCFFGVTEELPRHQLLGHLEDEPHRTG